MLPADLIPEILIRVPAESLPRFRTACKAWRSLIDDHRFLKRHIRRQQQSDDAEHHIISADTKGKIYSMSLSSLASYSHTSTTTIKAKCLKELVSSSTLLRHPFYLKDLVLANLPSPSCDGLILICSISGKPWALYNPFLSEYHELPEAAANCTSSGLGGLVTSGFGYDSIHDDYKVVKLYGYDYVVTTLIYSLKSNEWHRIEDLPNCSIRGCHGVFFNGTIHWIVNLKLDKVNCILALDLRTEKYQQIPIPRDSCGHMSLDALGARLFISSCDWERMDVWMMQDSGENVIWTKFLSLDHHLVENCDVRLHRPVVHLTAYEKTKEKVLIIYSCLTGDCDYKRAFWFDLVKRCSIEVPLQDLHGVILGKGIPARLVRLSAVQEGSLSK